MTVKYYVDGSGNYLGGWEEGHAGIPGGSTEVANPPPINASQVWGFPNWGPVVPSNTMISDNKISDKDSGTIVEAKSKGLNSADAETAYSNLKTTVVDNTDGSEDGCIVIETIQGGAITEVVSFEKGITLNGAAGGDQGVGTVNTTALHINGGAAVESGANDGFKTANHTAYNSPGDFTPGTTTVLTMPAASVGDNKANVQVVFEGLEQRSSEWQIVGTTITFNSAIPTGITKVDIKVLTNS